MRFVPRYKGEALDPRLVSRLAEALHLPVPLAQCLVQRGIENPEQAAAFFSGGMELLHDPFALDGMQAAVDCIESSLWADEPIVVYGDYDVDGTCATSILVEHLRSLGAPSVEFQIPSRHMEGYGLHKHSVEKMAARGTKLLITVDCGVSNVEEVALAKSLGMKVVITDHHECPEELPPADAIVNPKKPGQAYPFPGLCGAAVAGKLVEALSGTDAMLESIDLIALATVADLVPLLDENRVLVRMGLEAINASPRPGIAALMRVAGLSAGSLHTGHLGFQLGPRINAGGRMELAGKSVVLLTSGEDSVTEPIARELDENNRARQTVEKQMLYEAQLMMDSQVDLARDRGIVLWNEKWNSGVLGIVASRLVEIYHRPTVLLGGDGEAFYGSGRSVPGVHLYEVLTRCRECFLRYGGHEQAAGMAVTREHLTEFREKFCAALDALEEELFVPCKVYDAILPLGEATQELAAQLRRLEPMGMGNPTPVFLAEGVQLLGTERMGKEGTHFRTLMVQDGAQVPAVAFRQEPPEAGALDVQHYRVLLTLQINEYRGQGRLQAVIQALCGENRAEDLLQSLERQRNRMERSYFRQLLLSQTEGCAGDPIPLSVRQFWTMARRRAIGLLMVACTYEAASTFLGDPRYETVRENFTVAWGDLREAPSGQNALLLAPQWETLSVQGYSRILLLDGAMGPQTRNFLAKQLRDVHFGVIMEGNNLGLAPFQGDSPWNTASMRAAYTAFRRTLRLGIHGESRDAALEELARAAGVPPWKATLALEVLEELGLMQTLAQPPYYAVRETPTHTQLDQSALWRDMAALAGRKP